MKLQAWWIYGNLFYISVLISRWRDVSSCQTRIFGSRSQKQTNVGLFSDLLHSAAWTNASVFFSIVLSCSCCKYISCTVYVSVVVFCSTDIFLTKAVWRKNVRSCWIESKRLWVFVFILFVVWLKHCEADSVSFLMNVTRVVFY